MQSLSAEAADSAESSARRTARAGARRELCMLYGHNSTKVGLDNPMCKRCAAGSTAREREDRPSDAGAGDACRA